MFALNEGFAIVAEEQLDCTLKEVGLIEESVKVLYNRRVDQKKVLSLKVSRSIYRQ